MDSDAATVYSFAAREKSPAQRNHRNKVPGDFEKDGLQTRYAFSNCEFCGARITDVNRSRLTNEICECCLWQVRCALEFMFSCAEAWKALAAEII